MKEEVQAIMKAEKEMKLEGVSQQPESSDAEDKPIKRKPPPAEDKTTDKKKDIMSDSQEEDLTDGKLLDGKPVVEEKSFEESKETKTEDRKPVS